MVINKKYTLVQTKEHVNELLEHIEKHSIIAFDTETSTLNPRTGEVVGFSISGQIGEGYYMPTMVWNKETETLDECTIQQIGCHILANKIIRLLTEKQLVMHNASFDCRYVLCRYGIDLLPALWVDTALLVHTVREEGAFGYGASPFGLKSIAIMIQDKIGLNVEEAANQEQINLKVSIKENGGSITKDNFEIYKADINLLGEYAAADADLTLRICSYFLSILQEEGLDRFFFEEEVMPLYKEVTVPMEIEGIKLDMPLIEKTRQAIIQDQEHYKQAVVDELVKLPQVREWILDSALAEFPPNKKGTWACTLVDLYKLPLPKNTRGYSLKEANILALDDHPAKEYLLTGDLSHLDEEVIMKVSLKLWKDANDGQYVNIQSKKQLGEIAFKYLKEKPISQTEKGQAQFNDDMIQVLAKKYEWCKNLRIYNKLLKIKSAYIDRFYEGAENGRFYPYFKQHGTVSGRYGSDLQQLPKPKEDGEADPIIVKYNNEIRAFFICDPGHVFVDTDYQSLEPRIFASISNDEGLQEIFRKGWDFYSTIAIKTEKLENVSPDPKDSNFLKKLDPVKRNKAKSYSLGIPYGMGAYALAMTLDIPQEEAEILVDGYINGFPGLKRWRESSREFVKQNGYVKNAVGRIRHLPAVKELYTKMGDNIMDWKYRKKLEQEYGKEVVMNLYRDYRNGLNNCLNYQIQSYAASVVNRAALAINRTFKASGIEGQVVAQIHDQLVCQVREDQVEQACRIIQDCMENTTKPSGVQLVAEPAVAKNFREGH